MAIRRRLGARGRRRGARRAPRPRPRATRGGSRRLGPAGGSGAATGRGCRRHERSIYLLGTRPHSTHTKLDSDTAHRRSAERPAMAATPAPRCAPGTLARAPAARAAAAISAAGSCSPQPAERGHRKSSPCPWKMCQESPSCGQGAHGQSDGRSARPVRRREGGNRASSTCCEGPAGQTGVQHVRGASQQMRAHGARGTHDVSHHDPLEAARNALHGARSARQAGLDPLRRTRKQKKRPRGSDGLLPQRHLNTLQNRRAGWSSPTAPGVLRRGPGRGRGSARPPRPRQRHKRDG